MIAKVWWPVLTYPCGMSQHEIMTLQWWAWPWHFLKPQEFKHNKSTSPYNFIIRQKVIQEWLSVLVFLLQMNKKFLMQMILNSLVVCTWLTKVDNITYLYKGNDKCDRAWENRSYLSTQNTHLHITALIPCSVCAILNLSVSYLNCSWISA